jgi:group I intron endonuclease
MGYIYKITNLVSGKCYIGETYQPNPQKRWKQHINSVCYKGGCPALKDAIKKYGLDSFKFEIVIICFDEDRFIYEKEYIKKYNCQVPNGYNILAGGIGGGGFGGKKHTEESIKKISNGLKTFRDNNPNHFDTYRERHQESMKNVDTSAAVKKSEKFRKAVEEGRVGGAAHKNRKKDKSEIITTETTIQTNIPKTIEISTMSKQQINNKKKENNKKKDKSEIITTETTVQTNNKKNDIINIDISSDISASNNKNNKIRESLLKYYRENEDSRKINIEKHREVMTKAVGRKIAQYTEKGTFIKEYNSIREADRLSGVKKSNIQHVLAGYRYTAGGYKWKYVD